MKIGYARVSTQDQTTALQTDALLKAGCDRIFEEKASGAKVDRQELGEALKFARKGDTLVVWKLDRLARSMKQLVDTIEDLRQRGINFISVTEGIDTTTAAGELQFHIFAALAQFERGLIRERTVAGLDAAKQRGRVGGRPCLDDGKLQQALALVSSGWSTKKAAETAGIGRSTLCRYLSVSKTSVESTETAVSLKKVLETPKPRSKANKRAHELRVS